MKIKIYQIKLFHVFPVIKKKSKILKGHYSVIEWNNIDNVIIMRHFTFGVSFKMTSRQNSKILQV